MRSLGVLLIFAASLKLLSRMLLGLVVKPTMVLVLVAPGGPSVSVLIFSPLLQSDDMELRFDWSARVFPPTLSVVLRSLQPDRDIVEEYIEDSPWNGRVRKSMLVACEAADIFVFWWMRGNWTLWGLGVVRYPSRGLCLGFGLSFGFLELVYSSSSASTVWSLLV